MSVIDHADLLMAMVAYWLGWREGLRKPLRVKLHPPDDFVMDVQGMIDGVRSRKRFIGHGFTAKSSARIVRPGQPDVWLLVSSESSDV